MQFERGFMAEKWLNAGTTSGLSAATAVPEKHVTTIQQ
jgi:hypothetical protein